MKLQRNLSYLGLLATSLCGMIGSGWLFVSMIAAKIAGPAAIISWIIGGIMIAVIAIVFAELSTMLPVAGSIVRFIHASHGSCTSFCISWLAWLSCVAVAPTEVCALLQYTGNFYPNLVMSHDNITILTFTGIIVALVMLLIITVINLIAIKKINQIITKIGLWKVIIPALTAITIISQHFDTSNFYQFDGFSPNGMHGILSAVAAIVVFSLLGFVESTSLSGETKNPQRSIPIAIIGSVIICIGIYLLLQVSFIGALNSNMLNHGWSSLHFSGDLGPFAGIAAIAGLVYLPYLIYADAFISPIGTAIAYTTTTARMNYAMGKNNYIPANMTKLNRNSVPYNAVIINFIVGAALLFPFSAWEDLVKFQSAAIIIAYAAGPIALLSLRSQAKELARPFKLPYYKLVSFLAVYACNLITYWSGWQSIWRLMLATIIGLAIFVIYSQKKQSKIAHRNFKEALWLLAHCCGITLISYYGNFGGMSLIEFGPDFLVIAAYSFIIIKIASKIKLKHNESQEVIKQLLIEAS